MRKLMLGTLLLLVAAPLSAQTPAEDAATLREIAGRVEALDPNDPEFDFTLADTTVVGDVVVPAGETWLIGDSVIIHGNLRTDSGTIALRPSSFVTFPSTPEQYVGGGMRYDSTFANDWGIWVGGVGVLDIQGTPKQSWNRTGTHSTWLPTDSLWIAPTNPGDYAVREWHPGDSIPQVSPLVPPAEVANTTRDVEITGGHIHISSSRPQRIEFVTLRDMGVSNPTQQATTGRYALHFHFMGEGSRGSIVRGVAAIRSRGRVFVPHESHGITFIDNVAVKSRAEAFWWDLTDRTEDVLVDRLAVLGVWQSSEAVGGSPSIDGMILCGGLNMEVRNSVVAGVNVPINGHGYHWASECDNAGSAAWTFNEGNVAHNNQGAGIQFWFNRGIEHHTSNFVTYRNGEAGIGNGAYSNSHFFSDAILFDDKILNHSSSKQEQVTGRGIRFERITVISPQGPAHVTGGLNVAPTVPTEYADVQFVPGLAPDGTVAPAVNLHGPTAGSRIWAIFTHCTTTDGRGLLPSDIRFSRRADGTFYPSAEGSLVRIAHTDGRIWEITLDMATGTQVVTEIQ